MVDFSARMRRDGVRSLLAVALASASGFALSVPAWAQTADSAAHTALAERDYDIPAQPLSAALVRFAEQSDLQILFSQDAVSGFTSRPLAGRRTAEAALAQMLPPGAPRIEIAGDHIVQVAPPARPQYAATENDEEIVVTGTRIRGAVPAGANLLTLDRSTIEETGQSTIFEVLRTLPQNFPGSQSEATQLNSANNNLSFGSAIDLRGLGSDATLTLVNGRRLAPAGFGNFVDASAIPLAAVQRIEVLADGASATYGSDAVGGVVNIITRTDFEGGETALRLGAAQGGAEEFNFSHTFGWQWAGGHAALGYEYRNRNALASSDRAFAANSDLRSLGGDNFSRATSSPGNITRIGATNVVLAIPDGQDGVGLTQADLLAGVVNYQNTREATDVLPEQDAHSLFFSGRQRLTRRIDVFADMFASERDAFMRNSAIMSNITVPQTNAFRAATNLFPGQGNMVIAYSFVGDAGPTTYETRARTFSGVLGIEADLASDWRGEVSYSYGRHRDHVRFGNSIDTAALNLALASANTATAFNPFGDGGDNAHIMDAILRHQITDNDSRLQALSLKADGPLFDLPAGAVRMALGLERRTESFRVDRITYSNAGVPTIVATPAPGERDTDAWFVEIAAPLSRAIDLSASVREEYSQDYGRALTPKVGLDWQLLEALRVRATWGLSFKAPRFDQTLSSIGGSYLTLTPAQDPLADGGSTGLLSIAGGNPDLEPEEAESWTAGFEYRPNWLAGASFSATYFDIDFANRISVPGDVLSAIANPAPYGAVLIRDPDAATLASYLAILDRLGGVAPADGVELIWDGRVTNLSSLRVRGIDASATYAFETDLGRFEASLSASHLLQFDRRSNPSSPGEQLLNTIYNPIDWRVRAGLSWSAGPWRASGFANYLGGYDDTISNPDREIDAWTTFDARLGISLSNAETSGSPRTELAFNISNLFDEEPPFANSSEGFAYDNRNASPLGRFVSIEVRRRW